MEQPVTDSDRVGFSDPNGRPATFIYPNPLAASESDASTGSDAITESADPNA